MKLEHNKWGKNYSTPYLSVIVNSGDWSIHFVVLNHHWWVVFKRG